MRNVSVEFRGSSFQGERKRNGGEGGREGDIQRGSEIRETQTVRIT